MKPKLKKYEQEEAKPRIKKLILVPPYDRLNFSLLHNDELHGWEILPLEKIADFNELPNETDFLLPINSNLELCKIAPKEKYHLFP